MVFKSECTRQIFIEIFLLMIALILVIKVTDLNLDTDDEIVSSLHMISDILLLNRTGVETASCLDFGWLN